MPCPPDARAYTTRAIAGAKETPLAPQAIDLRGEASAGAAPAR